jgi:hypothetical protein
MTDLAKPVVRSPKRAESYARKALRRASSVAPGGGGLLFRQDFNPVALALAASPATVLDNPYTSGTSARSARVSVAVSGTLDAPATVSAQLVRDGIPFGAPVTWVSDAANKFGGSIDQLAPTFGPAPQTHTYGLLLTSAGRTFNVPIGSAGFAISDL